MKKIKIVGKDNVGWSIDKDNKNITYFLSKLNNVELTESYFFAEVYVFVWYNLVFHSKYFFVRLLKRLFGSFGKKKKIIAWITNDVTQSDVFLLRKWPVDLWISPNLKISSFLNKNNYSYITIPFYVSSRVFKKLPDSKELLAKKLGLNFNEIKDKLLIGSFQRDSLGSALDQPKWQKNTDLLIKICQLFPKGSFVLVLAGPRRHYFINKCLVENIPYVYIGNEEYIKNNKDDILINNISEDIINLLYNLVDMYLITSRSEGGPKAVLEASLARTIICSTDVGLARDFLHPDLLYSEDSINTVKNIFNYFMQDGVDKNLLDEYRDYNYYKVISVLKEDNYQSLIKKAIDMI